MFLFQIYFFEKLKEKIEFSSDYEILENNISIYQISSNNIAVLSSHKKVDELLLEQAGVENNDSFILSFKKIPYQLLFGSSDLISHL